MKQIIVGFSLMFAALTASAQLYVRANVGYNVPVNSDLIGQNYSYENADAGYIEKFRSVYGSYGAGISIRAAVGGSLNGMLGYDVEAGYLLGKEYSYTGSYQYSESENETETKSSSRSFQVAPSLTFTAGTGKIQPFARVGPMIAFSSLREKNSIHQTYGNSEYTENSEYNYSGGMSLGFKSTVGVSYSIAPKLQLYLELDFVSLSYAPTKREITKYMVNGQDQLSNIQEKVVELKKDYETVSEEGDPPVRESHSMGSTGLQVGVKFSLN